MSRIVCQFSCGAASAVATKLALAQHGDKCVIVNAYVKQEHEDNRRFLADCEAWFGQPVTVLRDEKYGADIIRVFRERGYMKGLAGAPCTTNLKRKLLDKWKQPGDVMVFGYTAEEADRLEDFRERNPDRPVIAPLVDAGLGKEDCKAMVLRAGIRLPLMYDLGYDNANCIGCVKGGEGYFRAIREDFPDEFEELCKVQDELGGGQLLAPRPRNECAIQPARPGHRTSAQKRETSRVFLLLRTCRAGIRALSNMPRRGLRAINWRTQVKKALTLILAATLATAAYASCRYYTITMNGRTMYCSECCMGTGALRTCNVTCN